MNAQPNTAARLEVPPPGGAVFFVVVGLIVVFFVGVAGFNLRHSAAHSPLEIGGSILWLCIVGALLVFAIADAGGMRPYLIKRLGMFSRRAFVEVCQPDGGPVTLRFGFACLGREFDYSHTELARIGMVSWGPGQASHMSGRDRNDWTVAVWYWKPGCTGPWDRRKAQDKDIVIVTPYLPKEDAAAVGRSVVELLRGAGVQLVPGDEENDFIVAHAEDDGAPLGPSEPAP